MTQYKGRGFLQLTGRQDGMGFRQHSRAIIGWSILEKEMVDGEPWATVLTSRTIAEWVREQPSELWKEVGDRMFDMHEKLVTLLVLAKTPT